MPSRQSAHRKSSWDLWLAGRASPSVQRVSRGMQVLWQLLRFRWVRPPFICYHAGIDVPDCKSGRRKHKADADEPMPLQYWWQVHSLWISFCRLQDILLQRRCGFPKQIERIGTKETQIGLHKIPNPLSLYGPGDCVKYIRLKAKKQKIIY